MKTKVMDAVFAALQGGALAALNGQPDTAVSRLKQEIEKLDSRSAEAIQRSKIDPQKWADVFVSGLVLGQKVRDIVRTMRGLP